MAEKGSVATKLGNELTTGEQGFQVSVLLLAVLRFAVYACSTHPLAGHTM